MFPVYLYIEYFPSMTLAHSEYSQTKTTRYAIDDRDVHPKEPIIGGRGCGNSKQSKGRHKFPHTSRQELNTTKGGVFVENNK